MQQFLNSIALRGSGIIRHFPSDIAANCDIWQGQTHVSALCGARFTCLYNKINNK
jgi:hypothetical protein